MNEFTPEVLFGGKIHHGLALAYGSVAIAKSDNVVEWSLPTTCSGIIELDIERLIEKNRKRREEIVGDGIPKDILSLSVAEQTRFRDAMIALKSPASREISLSDMSRFALHEACLGTATKPGVEQLPPRRQRRLARLTSGPSHPIMAPGL